MDEAKSFSNMEVDKMSEGSRNGERSSYRSFRKKFRKMKFKFEQKMNQSNVLYKQEQDAAESARRLAIENDQLLDLLLDVNNSAQIPGHLRIEVSLDTPPISAVPPLISDSLPTKCPTPESTLVRDQIRSLLDARLQAKLSSRPTKSLSSLMSTVPHAPFEITTIPYDLSSTFPSLSDAELESISFKPELPQPLSFVSPDDIDDYIANIDTALSLPPAPRVAATPSTRRFPIHLSDKDLQVRNPNSVYNWLRRHEPRIFLQDGEGSEGSKSVSGKPGALRGAGKRASIPVPSRLDGPVEFVEEDGIGYDVSLGAAGGGLGKKDGKRKRVSLDDAGYRPKGGISRPMKRKKKEEGGEVIAGPERKSSAGARGKIKIEAETETEEPLTDGVGLGS